MSRAIIPRKPLILDLVDFFNPEKLRAENALQDALSECESVFHESNLDLVFEDLLSTPTALVQLVLSGIENYAPLCSSIMNRFPNDAASFPTSLAAQLLKRFSLFFCFLNHPFPDDITYSLNQYRRSVELAFPVLRELASFEDPIQDAPPREDELFADDPLWSIKTKKQQNKKRVKKFHVLDEKPFRRFGVDVPSTRQDAEDLSTDILQDQRVTLEYYLATLRLPGVHESIKLAYIPSNIPEVSHVRTNGNPQESTVVQDSSNEVVPMAYPIVQPMRAALYFDSVKGFGSWRILISTRADRRLREARKKEPELFKIIVKKMKELSKGHFSNDNQKRLNGGTSDIPIYEAKMTRDSRLVYQVDCIPEYDSEVERQVLRVFGIYTHAQLDGRLWDSVGHQLGRKGKEYKRRCIFRNHSRCGSDPMILPASFPPLPDDTSVQSTNFPELPHEDLDQIHSLLVLDKFVPFSQALLNSLIAECDVAHVFNVTPQEKEIIEHAHSCYVLGRSGTGKTTTMIFKILGMERAWELHNQDMKKPRQVFVTKSRVLAEKVSEYFSKLSESLSVAGRSPKELARLAKSKPSQQEEGGLIDLEDEPEWRQDLPSRFSLLEERHFPLFITFDWLCKLLEADIQSLPEPEYPSFKYSPTNESDDINTVVFGKRGRRQGALVTYTDFLESYWPHFTQGLTKGLDPSLVFSEFMGVIKGSSHALASEGRCLERESYEKLSFRSHSTFASQRDTIFSIFELYARAKGGRGEYDVADRTYSILKVLEERGVRGQKIDYLYVDEAQDNLLIDAFLLRLLCRNPDGLFWAGDTAQTISLGSSFRFNELKSFLFDIERRREKSNGADLPQRLTQAPRTFELAINYRSHGGIVNCAQSVIELITKFWPDSIDILPREKGIVEGLKPVFFTGWDQDTVRYEQFLFGESGNRIEFGAQQCILVRDEVARDNLRQDVGDIGLIMTIYEAKGLEFGDVLLYNFFQDSAIDLSRWRVVLNSESSTEPAPRFDEIHHASICSELKFLYVAITRARQNLWIVDCSEKSQPMRVYWTRRGQVQNCTPGTDVPRLAVSSTPEEWAAQGRTLFQNKRYLQSMHCFERASLPREMAVAEAFLLREKARSVQITSKQGSTERSKAFLVAAEAFLGCAEAATRDRLAYFRNAGDCFERGGEKGRAAEAYLIAKEYTLAADVYHKASMVDDAVRVVKTYRAAVQDDLAETIKQVARLYYFKENKMDQANELFSSDEEELEFTEMYDLDEARSTLLETLGRYADAAELHLAEGRTLEAIKLFLMDEKNITSVRRGYDCILQGLWQHLPFGVTRESAQRNDTLSELLKMGNQLNTQLLEPSAVDEISMFHAIMSGNTKKLQNLGRKFHEANNHLSALHCFDHVFVNPPPIQVMEISDALVMLEMFSTYAWLLHDVAFDPDPPKSPSLHKLFGFRSFTEDTFLIPAHTFLRSQCRDTSYLQSDQGSAEISISYSKLLRVFKQSLCERLSDRVMAENTMCSKARPFSPCVPFVVFGRCYRRECHQAHTTRGSLASDWYNSLVRLHMQQFLILRTLRFDYWRHRQELRSWINRLHNVLNPPHYLLGTVANLDLSLIPEASKGVQAVNEVVRHEISRLDPNHFLPPPPWFLTSVLTYANLCFTFDGKEAPGYLHSSPCVMSYRYPDYLRDKGGGYVVAELMGCLHGSNPECLSAGILSLRHIINKRLPINVGILCDFIDYLCGSLILEKRYKAMSLLHNVTMPRSWITRLSRTFGDIGKRDPKHFWMIVPPLAELLHQMYAHDDYLYFPNRDRLIWDIFLARVCRDLCLLGYNMKIEPFRDDIGNAIHSIKKKYPQGPFGSIYSPYVNAQRWDHLVRAVRGSTDGSAMDEMIQICHKSQMSSLSNPLPKVRRIIINNVNEILPALHASHAPQTSALRADAEPFVPSTRNTYSLLSSEVTEGTPEIPEAIDGTEDDDVEDDLELVEDSESHQMDAVPLNIPQAWHDTDLPSESQIKAACLIQTAYRRVLCHRKRTATTGLDATRTRIFSACYNQALKMEWPSKYYRLLFLGPLVHVLLCLERIQELVLPIKNVTKKSWAKAKYQELADLGKRLTLVTGILKEAKQLQSVLKPDGSLHTRPSRLPDLKKHVLEVEKLVDQLPMKPPLDVRDNIHLGLRGIVKEKEASKKTKQKPELCTDDLYDV